MNMCRGNVCVFVCSCIGLRCVTHATHVVLSLLCKW